MKKYDIYIVNLGSTKGSEESGIRPCVIVSNNINNAKADTVQICPITNDNTGYPMHALIIEKEYNINSTMLAEQIRTVSKSRLIKRVCTIYDIDTQYRINYALKVQLIL